MTNLIYERWLKEGNRDLENQILQLDNYGDHTWIFFESNQEKITVLAVDPRLFYEKPEILDHLVVNNQPATSPESPGSINQGQDVSESLSSLQEFIEGFKNPILVGFDFKSFPLSMPITKIDLSFLTKNKVISVDNIYSIMASIKRFLDFGKF